MHKVSSDLISISYSGFPILFSFNFRLDSLIRMSNRKKPGKIGIILITIVDHSIYGQKN